MDLNNLKNDIEQLCFKGVRGINNLIDNIYIYIWRELI